MAQPTNLYDVYDAGGATGVGVANAEDVSDVIWNVDPTDTPVASAIPKTSGKAIFEEYLTDSLASAAQNATIEGYCYSLAY
jgi:hypothetical protein